MTQKVYARSPIRLHGTIPVFSVPNDYTENYERIAGDELDSIRRTGENPFIPGDLWRELENSTIALIQKHSKDGDNILDVGVGLGRVLSHFPNLHRYGMDISFGLLTAAQTKGIEVCYALISDMPYQEEFFDLIVTTDVLEHVLDLNQSVYKILSVLKKHGTLIVRVPYRENLSGYTSPEYPYKYVHMRTFDEHSLRLLFERIFDCAITEIVFAGYMPYLGRFKPGRSVSLKDAVLVKLFCKLPTRIQMSFFASLKRENILRKFFWALSFIDLERYDKFFTMLDAFNPTLHEALLREWHDPIDINIVVQRC